jgi:hypothetical protein
VIQLDSSPEIDYTNNDDTYSLKENILIITILTSKIKRSYNIGANSETSKMFLLLRESSPVEIGPTGPVATAMKGTRPECLTHKQKR